MEYAEYVKHGIVLAHEWQQPYVVIPVDTWPMCEQLYGYW